ncbi:MAG: class I SAM-dependent methyltransferase [Gemmatimonadota bacterium]
MDYAAYLGAEEARMLRETRFYYRKYAALLAGCAPVVDIGCGTGNFLSLASGLQASGLDTLAANAAACRARGLWAPVGSITSLPYRSGSLGGVFCAHVLEHLERDELLAAAAEIERVLRPGGRAVVVVPRPRDIWDFYTDPTHVSPMTERRLAMLFNRFSDVRFVNYYLPLAKGLLTVRLDLPGVYDALLRAVPFRGRTSITAVLGR